MTREHRGPKRRYQNYEGTRFKNLQEYHLHIKYNIWKACPEIFVRLSAAVHKYEIYRRNALQEKSSLCNIPMLLE